MVSCPHFLKTLFKLVKYGLSYSLKRDPRLFSKFTKVCTILSLTASKNAFWRLLLIVWKFNLDWKVKLSPFECPVYQWQPPKCIFGGCQWIKWCNFCTFWEWPQITFWAVAEATLDKFDWNFQKIWVWYQLKFAISCSFYSNEPISHKFTFKLYENFVVTLYFVLQYLSWN